MERTVEEILADIDNASVDELLCVADGSTVGEEQAGAVQDETAKADPAPSGDAATQATTEQKAEESPVLARDGKNTIPYEVLAKTREAKEAAEAKAQAEAEARTQAEAKLAELQAKLESVKAGATEKAVTLTPEEQAEMQENFPAMAKMFASMQAELTRLQSNATAQQQTQQEVQQNEMAKTVQDHIDANPKLAFLQASDPDAWKRACDLDEQLRTNPATASLPMAERFTKAAAAYEAIYGAINLPAAPTKPAAPAKSVDDVLAKAGAAVPKSLSDLPGGSAVASSEVGNLENLSGAEIGNTLMKMSPQAREAYLNSLG